MIISKEELQQAIQTVKPGLANKEQIEQTTSFIFQESKVITYNDEISISHPVEGLDMEGSIKAEEFYKLLGKLKQDELDIDIKENKVYLKAGNSKAFFTLTREIQLPFKEKIGKMGEWKKLPGEFNRLAKFAMGACSRDMSEPIYTCVHVNEAGYLEGTDSYRIARCHLDDKMPIKTFFIPATSINEVLKIQPTHIASGNGWVHFSNGEETVISSRIFQSKYKDLDLSPFMEVEGVKVEFPASIISAIEKASIFAKRDVALDEQIEINITAKKLMVSGKSDTGRFEEKAPIQYEGDQIGFIVAPYLLLDILQETSRCIISDNALKFQGEGWEYVSVLQNKEE